MTPIYQQHAGNQDDQGRMPVLGVEKVLLPPDGMKREVIEQNQHRPRQPNRWWRAALI